MAAPTRYRVLRAVLCAQTAAYAFLAVHDRTSHGQDLNPLGMLGTTQEVYVALFGLWLAAQRRPRRMALLLYETVLTALAFSVLPRGVLPLALCAVAWVCLLHPRTTAYLGGDVGSRP